MDRGLGRTMTLGVAIAGLAAMIAGATIWLALTDPVAVANAIEDGEVSPLVIQLADVLYSAILGLLQYL